MALQKRQGIVSGYVNFNDEDYIEIFDNKYDYLYGKETELDIDAGVWVSYFVSQSPSSHPRNCKYFAEEVSEVKPEYSTAPTSDDFVRQKMNVNYYNRVDYFQYDHINSVLTHKTSVKRVPNGEYASEYYGLVKIDRDDLNRLHKHGIDEINVTTALIPSGQYTGGPHWKVTQFMHEGKPYSLNGFLSITGRVLRGPGGVVRSRCEVKIPQDSLRPIGYNPNTAARPNPPCFGHLRNSAENHRVYEENTDQKKTNVGFSAPKKTARESVLEQERLFRLHQANAFSTGLSALNEGPGFGRPNRFGTRNNIQNNLRDISDDSIAEKPPKSEPKQEKNLEDEDWEVETEKVPDIREERRNIDTLKPTGLAKFGNQRF